MYKKVLSVFLIIALAVTMIPMPLSEAYAADTNENDEPSGFIMPVEQKTEVPEGYIGIYTKTDLNNIRNDLKANYILMNDIEFTKEDFQEGGEFPKKWIPIEGEFEGIFDGNGYAIIGLDIGSKGEPVGLFEAIKGTIKNVCIKDIHISISTKTTDTVYIGTIAAKVGSNGVVDNCYITGTTVINNSSVESGIVYFGGLVGSVEADGTVKNGYNSTSTNVGTDLGTENVFVGGIAGKSAGTVKNCNNSGNIKSHVYAGGIIGYSSGSIVDCNNTGEIYSQLSAAGIVATAYNKTQITGCYNNGNINVTGSYSEKESCVGGIAAEVFSGVNITDCYNTGEIKLEQSVEFYEGYIGGIAGNVDTLSDADLDDYYFGYEIYTEPSVIDDCYNTGRIYSKVESVQINSGGIVGCAFYNVTIKNSYNTSDVHTETKLTNEETYATPYSGGIAGYMYGSNITMCYNRGNIQSISLGLDDAYAGGITGSILGGRISKCYNEGAVLSKTAGTFAYAGGIAGDNYSDEGISNCFNIGVITVSAYNGSDRFLMAGGIVGENVSEIINCYNAEVVSSNKSEAYVDGIAGDNEFGTVINCYILEGICNSNCAGVKKINFNSKGLKTSYSGFDFIRIWVIDNSDNAMPYIKGLDKPTKVIENTIVKLCDDNVIIEGEYEYTGSAIIPQLIVTYKEKVLTKNLHYTVKYTSNINIGTAKVTVTGIGRYEGTVEKTFEILPVSGSKCTINLSETIYNYDGKVKTPSVCIYDKGNKLIVDQDYKVQYDEGRIDAGSYNVTIEFFGKYRGTIKKPFTIKPIEVEFCKVKLSQTSYYYDGKVKTPSVTVYDLYGKKYVPDKDYIVKYDKGRKEVGEYTVTIQFIGNSQGCFWEYFSIIQTKPVNYNATISQTSYCYDGKVKTPSVTVKDSHGNTLKLDKDYKLYYDRGRKNIGFYEVLVEFIGSYSGSTTLSFTIGPKDTSGAKVKLTGHDDVKISWKKVKGAKGYNVYYKKAGASSYKKLTTTTGNPIKGDTYYCRKLNLADGTKYYFKVCAYKKVDGIECQNNGKTLSVTTLKKVKSVKAKKSGSKVKISWSNISGESGYQISQSTSKSKTGTITTYKTTKGKSKTISATKGKTYYYKVRAYKTVGDKKIYGPWSSVVKYKR